MRHSRLFLAIVLVSVAVTPATAQRGGDPITLLEAARSKTPQNVAALRGLGVAYYKAQRFADARAVLEQARQLDPKDGVSTLYLGLAAERLGDLTSARRAYESYLTVGATRRVKLEIRTRLVSLSRNEAIASAKAAVANEATITATPGSVLTVAVPPLRFNGTDSTLKPLERGMAELLITDLSRSARLIVVERDRMQALTDELRLSESERVDAATAVRAGKLMQAGSLVNGIIQQVGANQLALDASIVTVGTGVIGEPAQVTSALDQLFDMEKRLVFQLFDRLGVTLTPAERQLVERRPTNNLQAFLAYSRGLQASDDGRFEDASRFFESARALDPGFGAATARFQAAAAAATSGTPGAEVSTTAIESSLGAGTEGQIAAVAATGVIVSPVSALQATVNNVTQSVNPPAVAAVAAVVTTASPAAAPAAAPLPQRDATSATTGTDQPLQTGQVVIIIRRP